MTETRLITVGEDSKICVWNLEHGTLGIHYNPCILEIKRKICARETKVLRRMFKISELNKLKMSFKCSHFFKYVR